MSRAPVGLAGQLLALTFLISLCGSTAQTVSILAGMIENAGFADGLGTNALLKLPPRCCN